MRVCGKAWHVKCIERLEHGRRAGSNAQAAACIAQPDASLGCLKFTWNGFRARSEMLGSDSKLTLLINVLRYRTQPLCFAEVAHEFSATRKTRWRVALSKHMPKSCNQHPAYCHKILLVSCFMLAHGSHLYMHQSRSSSRFQCTWSWSTVLPGLTSQPLLKLGL